MNDDQEMFLKFCMFGSLLIAPFTTLGPIYLLVRDLKMGQEPPIKELIALEFFFIVGNLFSYWVIKRMGLDFWNKDKK